MDSDKIKEAFQKAKQDIDSLKSDISFLTQDIQDIKSALKALVEYESHKQPIQKAQEMQEIQQTNQPTDIPTEKYLEYPANQPQTPGYPTQNSLNPSLNEPYPTYSIPSTQELHYKALKQPFTPISTGNDGVPTNQPTNQQTNKHPLISHGNQFQNNEEIHKFNEKNTPKTPKMDNFDKISHLEQVSHILETLDDIKKDLRHKFKHLTSQEMLVFSSIYQLESEGFTVDYSILAKKLNLTEISIRDYTHKLIKKGIPLIKTKENNKKIIISISQELKKIASLSTILSLREI